MPPVAFAMPRSRYFAKARSPTSKSSSFEWLTRKICGLRFGWTAVADTGRLACAARTGFARDFATCLRAAGRRAVGLAFVLAMVVLRPTAPHERQFRGPTAFGQRQ